ncbi:MAG: gluconate 2-dehydrogenase subunit 3 family protein, partial [Rhodothermales bacterium]
MQRREALKKTALLGGSAALSTSLLGLLQSCQQQPRLGWQPTFLSEDHARLVSSLVDTLLPATDTPGGLDVKVDMFIDLVMGKMYDAAGQQQAVADMDAFNARSAS